MLRLSGRFLALSSWLIHGLLFISLWRGLFDDPRAFTAPLSAGALRLIAGCLAASLGLLVLPATQGTVRLFCFLLFLPLALVVPGGLTPFWALSVFFSLGFLLAVLQVWGLTPDRYLISDEGLPSGSRAGLRRRAGLQFLLSGIIGVATVLGVLGSNRLGRDHLVAWLGGGLPNQRTGLSAFVDLGAIDELKKSDRILLHVRGKSPDLLRVRVFPNYKNGRWIADERESISLALVEESLSDLNALRFRRISGRDSWVALPSEPGRIWSESSLVLDRGGGVRGAGGRSPDRWSWAPSGEVAADLSEDLKSLLLVPPHLQGALAENVRLWGGQGDIGLQAQLDALTVGLQRTARYALSFERTPGMDPVLDFLTAHPQGNCEAFASAFALLARSSGVPARVVTGFRVSERNPLSGHWIVRERDAHAWVEVHMNGRWVTRDPTPAVLGQYAGGDDSSQLSYLLDALHSQVILIWDRAFDMTLDEIALVVLLLGGVLMGYQFQRHGRRRTFHLELQAESMGSLPQFEQLERELRELGYIRLRGETLLGFSRRLELAGGDLAVHGEWIRRYAAWRYGSIGTRAELERSFVKAIE